MVRVRVSDRIYGQRRPTVFSSDATRGLQTFCSLVTSKHTMARVYNSAVVFYRVPPLFQHCDFP